MEIYLRDNQFVIINLNQFIVGLFKNQPGAFMFFVRFSKISLCITEKNEFY